EVKALSMQEAQTIYKEKYWFEACCHFFSDAIAIAMFDCAVNQGVGRAKKLLQSALRVKVDGAIGPKTLAAVERAEEEELLRDFMAKRAMHYSGLKTLFTFGYGWFRRIFDVYGRALVRTKFIESRLK
ncbi:MAG: putative peptidoglycan-binding domain-containing protein, partial [Nitrosopumilus sp.]